MIDKALGLNCPDPAETYSSSPHLYEELGIPTEAAGTVGTPQKAAKRPERKERGERQAGDDSAKPTRTRSRRRTRGGEPATGHVETPRRYRWRGGRTPPRARTNRPDAAAGAARANLRPNRPSSAG